jgi:hypothetical protein
VSPSNEKRDRVGDPNMSIRGERTAATNFSIGIELTTPFDCIEQQFPEARSDRFAHIVRKICLQFHDEGLNPLGSLACARN